MLNDHLKNWTWCLLKRSLKGYLHEKHLRQKNVWFCAAIMLPPLALPCFDDKTQIGSLILCHIAQGGQGGQGK